MGEEMKRQWRAHRAKGYLLSSIKDPELKWHVERTSMPRMLPKLPQKPPSIVADSAKQNSVLTGEEVLGSSSGSTSPGSTPSKSTSSSNHSTQMCGSETSADKADDQSGETDNCSNS